MITSVRLVISAAVIAICFSFASPTQAAPPFMHGCGHGMGYYGLGGLFETPYATDRIPTPPYFALHPPVYYSAPVPRTYGISPFAYPGTFRSPEIEVPQPLSIKNPHVESRNVSDETTATYKKPVKPLLIENPFVTQPSRVASKP